MVLNVFLKGAVPQYFSERLGIFFGRYTGLKKNQRASLRLPGKCPGEAEAQRLTLNPESDGFLRSKRKETSETLQGKAPSLTECLTTKKGPYKRICSRQEMGRDSAAFATKQQRELKFGACCMIAFTQNLIPSSVYTIFNLNFLIQNPESWDLNFMGYCEVIESRHCS